MTDKQGPKDPGLPDMATGVMEEYFARLGMLELSGVLGFAFESGTIAENHEATDETRKPAANMRNHMNMGE